jgi:hypothetical protein
MAKPTVFISYRHGAPSTSIARKLHTALKVISEALKFDVFMDEHDVEPADLFDKKIVAGLKETTHFIALIDNEYWTSEYCRKELGHAISGYEKNGKPLLLFVQAGSIDPQYLTIDAIRAEGKIKSRDPLIKRISDVQFLGPFSRNRRLERLRFENSAKLQDQILSLTEELVRVLQKPH